MHVYGTIFSDCPFVRDRRNRRRLRFIRFLRSSGRVLLRFSPSACANEYPARVQQRRKASVFWQTGMVWRALKTFPVPTDVFAVAQYYAGKVSGVFRARISTPIMGGTGTVSVWPLVGVLIGNTKAALEPIVR